MKKKQCWKLLVHSPHAWYLGNGESVAPEAVSALGNVDLGDCPGLTEERATQPLGADRDPKNPQPPCEICGTWICDCGHYRRPRANRHPDVEQICARCGGNEGMFVAARHRDPNLHVKE